MPSLREILDDPNYVNANSATKAAIFDKWAPKDDNYAKANDATKFAIRERFGVIAPKVEEKKVEEQKPVQATEPSESSSDLIRGFTSYLPQLQETYGGAKVLAGKLVGSKDLMQSGLETMAAAKAELATKHKASDSFTDALGKGVGTVLTDWLPYQIGSGAANLVESLGVMFAGAAAGSLAAPGVGTLAGGATGLVEKELVKRGIKELAEKVAKESGEEAAKELFERETKAVVKDLSKRYAAGAALAAQAGFHGAGETTSRAVEEAQRLGKEATDIELERVLPSAIVHGVAEYFGDKIGLGAWKNINEDAKKSMLNLAGSFLKNIAVTGTKEAPVEVIQSAAERFGASLSLTDAQAVKEYIDSAAAAYGMAVGPAAGGTVRSYADAMAKEDARLAEEQIKVQQASQQAEEEAAKISGTAVVDPQGNVAPVSFAPIQQGSVGAATTAAAPAVTTAAPAAAPATTAAVAAPTISNDTIEAAYAANDVSTSKVQKDLKPQLEAMGLTTAAEQKAFLVAKRDELGIPAYNPKARGMEAIKSQQAKTQWETNYQTRQLLKEGEPSVGQLNEVDLARDQSGAPSAPPESGITPGGATTPISGGVVPIGRAIESATPSTPAQPITLEQQIVSLETKLTDGYAQLAAIKDTRQSLLSKNGKLPAKNSEKRQEFDALGVQHDELAVALDREVAAPLFKLKKEIESVAQTSEAVKAEEKGQKKEPPPPIDPEILRAAYSEQAKIATESGLEFPAWGELSEAERAALTEEVQATRGMLPSKRERQKSSFLSPVMAAVIKSRIDKKIASGEIDLTATPQAVVDAYNENYKNQEGRLPKWESLNNDQKAIYLSAIRKNTALEQDAAFNRLNNYRKSAEKLTEEGAEEGSVSEGASIYETNRQAYSPSLPKWADLDSEAQQKFLDAIKEGLNVEVKREKTSNRKLDKEGKIAGEKNGNKVAEENIVTSLENQVTQEQMDTGFADVYIYNAEKETKETTPAKEREQRNEEIRRETRRQEGEQVDTGYRLPKSVILQLFNGDIKGVLQYLSQNAKGMAYNIAKITGRQLDEKLNNFRAGQAAISRGVFRQLSRTLGTVSYDTKVVMEESNAVVKQLRREGKLAAYDPKTDTLYFTNDGLDEQTVLHEITHAGTVKILYKYKTDPNSLTQEQREAAEHIEKIYEFAKSRLGGKHKFAFENVYEFVSYAMTDVGLQRDLSNIQARSLGKYTTDNKPFLRSILSRFGSLWGQFTQALMKMYGLTKAGRTFTPAENIPDDIVKGFNELQQEELTSGKKGVIYQRPASERVSKEAIARGSAQAGYEANLLVEMSEAFGRILSVPEAGINIEALPAKKPAKPPIQAPAEGSPDFKAMRNAMPQYNTNPAKELSRMSKTKLGELAVRTFQNDRAAIKNWESKLRFAGRLVAYAAGFNNIYTQLTLSSGNAHYLYAQYIQNHNETIRTEVAKYAEKRGLSIDEAVNELGLFAIAAHEEERRRTLYIRNVPLVGENPSPENPAVPTLKDAKGNLVTPFEARNAILKYLDTHYLDESGAKYLREQLDKIVDDKNNLSKEKSDELNLDINSQTYNVAGFSPDQIKAAKAEYEKNKTEADVILKEIKELNKVVIALNEKSNYLSKYAKNYFMFYGYENYVPFKGKHFNEDKADIFNIDSRRLGGELQDQIHTFEGRLTVPDNPILQVMSDGAQAAMRAGRKDVTQAIYNAVKDKTLQGSIMKFKDANGKERDYISFEDRANDDILTQLKGETKVFHYMPDGKVAIIQIDNKDQREAIRRSYRETNPLLDSIVNMGNLATGALGQMHTRYNVAFAPVNFVRDVLTNAFTLGAELGPKEVFRYIGAVASNVATGGMKKSMNFARLYSQGKTSTIEALANSDKTGYYRDMLDYIKTGGKVSYIAGIAPKGQYQEFFKGAGGNIILNKKEQVDKYFDMWIDTFELSARVAAFQTTKSNEIARLTKKDPTKSKKEIEEAATVTASAYAKNLANFEQVGQWGKALGAFFMFFRPSATGAVRAIDAIAPALNMNIERAVISTPEYARAANIRQELSKGVSATKEKELKAELAEMDKAVETFRENYSKAKTSARVMSVALVGMGVTAYLMSLMMADDDDLGRNKTATDDMSRWTRFARFPIPGTEIIVQIPWGFGLGGMAAMGAQMASIFNGNTRPGDLISNMFVIGMDSFLPLPVSRINPVEKPLPFLVDSMMPSFMRPMVEYTMNVDALGRKIYNDRTSRLGDAYTGGDNIPELYKDAAIWWLKTTGYDVSPNSLYFFANNYADGATRLVQNANNVRLWASDKKDFNPKTDLMILDSFFGTKANFDAREWSRVESDLEERSKYVKMLKSDHPLEYSEYMAKNPLDQMLTKMYDHDVNGRLKDLREQANKWRAMEGLDPRTRTALVKNIVLQQDFEKRRLIDLYKAYGVEP